MFSVKRFVRDYFGFSKTQTNGFLVLMPLILVLLLFPTLYRRLTPETNDKFDSDRNKLDSLMGMWFSNPDPKALNEANVELVKFDPNKAAVVDLVNLGMNRALAQRIENYRVAGGKFKVKSDLKKIYGMPDSLFIVLEPFIQIAAGSIENRSKVELGQRSAFPTFAQPSKSSNLASEYNEVVRVEINSADTLELRKLKGIGPSYSNRIVKYREALGGFVTLEQIKEVYGISDSLFSQIASNIYLETMEVRSVNINIATFKELNSHPYISFEQTKDILNLKSKNGKFSGLDDLMKLKTFDSLQIAKLYPYLKF